jgi:hypothetical protein
LRLRDSAGVAVRGRRYLIGGLVPVTSAYESMGCGRDALRVTLA